METRWKYVFQEPFLPLAYHLCSENSCSAISRDWHSLLQLWNMLFKISFQMLIPYTKTWKNILLQMVILNFRQFILKFLILILWFNDHDLLSIPLVAHHDSNHIILCCKVCAKLHAPQRTQISCCLRALIPLDGTHLKHCAFEWGSLCASPEGVWWGSRDSGYPFLRGQSLPTRDSSRMVVSIYSEA